MIYYNDGNSFNIYYSCEFWEKIAKVDKLFTNLGMPINRKQISWEVYNYFESHYSDKYNQEGQNKFEDVLRVIYTY